MKKSSLQWTVLMIAVGLSALMVVMLGGSREPLAPSDAGSSASVPASGNADSSRAPASAPAAPSSMNKHEEDTEAARSAKLYFHRQLEGRGKVGKIYQSVLEKLPPGSDSELVAIYIAEGITRNAGPEFAKFMSDLHTALAERSMELFDLLQNREQAFRDDPYNYQMTLNLAARLALPGDMKAQLLGDAMNIHFTPDPNTGITRMTGNITNALILMKNYGVTAEQAAPYIQHGAQVNSDDPRALSEFAARANTYFPGSLATR